MRKKKYKIHPTGIYAIVCNLNNKKYVGQTKNEFKKRLSEHFTDLRKNKHHSAHLQRAYNKYGKENFDYIVIEEIPVKKGKAYFTEREQYWIDTLDTYKNGYNACAKAELPPTAADPDKYGELTAKRAVPSGYIIKDIHTQETQNITNLSKFCKENKLNYDRAQIALYGANKHVYDNKYEIKYANEKEAANCKYGVTAHLNGRKSTYIVTHPDGKEEHVPYLAEFCREHNLSHGNMIGIAKGTRNQHKGYKCRYDVIGEITADRSYAKNPKDIALENIAKHFKKHPDNVITTAEMKQYIINNNIKGFSGQGTMQLRDICRILEIPKPWFSRKRKCYCISQIAIDITA